MKYDGYGEDVLARLHGTPSGWEAREAEITARVKTALAGIGIVAAQDAGDLLTEIVRLRNRQLRPGVPTLDELCAARGAFDALVAAYRGSVDEKYRRLYVDLYASLDVDWTTLPNQALVASVKHEIEGHWTVRTAHVDLRHPEGPTRVLVLGVSDKLTEETRPEFARRFRALLDEQTNEHDVAHRVLGRVIW